MKIINGKNALVEIKDLDYLRKAHIFLDKSTFYEVNRDDMFVEYDNQDAADFFAARSDIIDYHRASSMSDKEIEDIINLTKRRLARYSDLWLATASETERREVKTRRLEYKRKIENYTEYKENREKYDGYVKKNGKALKLTNSFDYDDEED